jgi:prepilin-type N-terminal cleavage/methylation domain-containing protein/prepilin-type processing-associated H-X9-DG protein
MRFRSQRLTVGLGSGHSLIELLVVLAVIGVLVAVLMPAVAQVRESSRRVWCGNNLRQIALGLAAYESQFRAFPPGCLECQPARFPPPPGFTFKRISWNALVLPHLEQHPTHARFHFDLPFYVAENLPAARTVIPTFLCPSTATTQRIGDTTGDRNGNGRWDPGDNLAYTDYGGLFGVSFDERRVLPEHEGVMLYDRVIRAADIRDGLSQTASVGECTGRDHRQQSEWANGHNLFDQRYNIPINRTQDNELFSDHPNGCHVALCDGHIAFLSDRIDQRVLNALLTRAGSEPLP